MIKINLKFDFDEQKMTDKFEKKRLAAQEKINAEVQALSTKFVPKRAGVLDKSGVSVSKRKKALDENIIFGEATDFEQVIYNTPYARYLYHGKVMIGKKPKTVTDKNLVMDKTRHPDATAKWFEVMKKMYWDTILEGAKKEFDNA